MSSIWQSSQHKVWEELYLHLAAGKSVRRFTPKLGVSLSKSGARWFHQAPDDMHPLLAMRWAQIRSLGGTEKLARLLSSSTVLLGPTDHEAFWESVIRFLIKFDPLPPGEAIDIVNFVNAQRFQPGEKTWGPGAGEQPLQPNFTLKGRTLRSLRRHMAHWRDEVLAKNPRLQLAAPGWIRSSIAPFRLEQNDCVWTIEELLNDKALRVEGGIMQHCVATYIHECSRRLTTIWSMKMQQGDRRKRILTIEVSPFTKRILLALGKQNAAPSKAAASILKQWARQSDLIYREREA